MLSCEIKYCILAVAKTNATANAAIIIDLTEIKQVAFFISGLGNICRLYNKIITDAVIGKPLRSRTQFYRKYPKTNHHAI